MPYIVQTAAAQMPQSCKGSYRRIAVIEVKKGLKRVSMISDRAKGVIRIAETWERLNVGTSPRCAYQKALAEAEALCAKLNREESYA